MGIRALGSLATLLMTLTLAGCLTLAQLGPQSNRKVWVLAQVNLFSSWTLNSMRTGAPASYSLLYAKGPHRDWLIVAVHQISSERLPD